MDRDKKIQVRNAVGAAIRKNDLIRGVCEVCGDTNAEAHHDDYEKPFEIRWLCFSHHREHHTNEAKLMPTKPRSPDAPLPKTDAERQALRRQRRKEEMDAMKAALWRIAMDSTDAKARTIAMRVLNWDQKLWPKP
jgi:SRSO17 transposase